MRSELYQQRPPDGRKIRKAPANDKRLRSARGGAGESGGSDKNHAGADKNASV